MTPHAHRAQPAKRTAARIAAGLAVTWLAGCSGFSADGGFGPVDRMVRERSGLSPSYQRTAEDAAAAQARVAALLAAPLSADGAVQLALLNNRGLQARLQELGIGEAALVRASRPPNPTLAVTRTRGGGASETDRSLSIDLLGLLTWPITRSLATQGFAQTQLQAASEVLRTAGDTRKAYFEAVAAQQLQAYATQVQDAAAASNELAKRMVAAGNFNAQTQMREALFAAEAETRLALAKQSALATRERLMRLFGLTGDGPSFLLPDRLPDLPTQLAGAQDVDGQDIERRALLQRLDVSAARQGSEATARALGLTRVTGFVNLLELGYADKRESGAARQRGATLELELPIFDFGATREKHAEAVYMQSVQQAAEVALVARSEVRESHAAYRSAFERALRLRDEVLPLRQRIAEQNLRRYNAMLISVFELLADAKEQIVGVTAAVEAQRDFWLAESDLQTAMAARIGAAR